MFLLQARFKFDELEQFHIKYVYESTTLRSKDCGQNENDQQGTLAPRVAPASD
jgi:hypothetical protein